jgi:hypothetical protein
MFYKTGVDITNDKQMFNFLKNHFEYWTMNSWNRLESIANNVKLYNLDLSGDWGTAYDLLASGEYETINYMIAEWQLRHRGYEVQFNGCSGGYLVLTYNGMNHHILPDEIVDNDTYEDYKTYCRDYIGSVKQNRKVLVEYTKLVQDFDKLCDELRDYCDELSRQTFEIITMFQSVEQFNEEYAEDLEYLEFDYLRMSDDGTVDVSEIANLRCLLEAFMRICRANCKHLDYKLVHDNEYKMKITKCA